MAIKLMDVIETAGDFPVINAPSVGIPGGGRLDNVFDEKGRVRAAHLPDDMGGSSTDPRVDELIETVGAVFDENGKVKEAYLPEDWVRAFVEEYIDEALRGDY